MIRCEGVTFAYPDGTRALDSIDISVAAGERVAIVGANGSGKSTLVRLWNGLLRPTSGRVLVDGQPTAGRRVAELARIVALTFQDPSRQLFRATARDEVAFGARYVGVGSADLAERVDAALDAVGLLHRAATNPYDLGPSKRRLLTIACALAMRPGLLVLDEPTTGLDTAEVSRVAAIVTAQESDRAVVAISHDMHFVASTFGRVVRLEAGRVVADGAPGEVLG